ncbi:acyl-CoA dehydrogenase family protein [Spongiibacter thalassae]
MLCAEAVEIMAALLDSTVEYTNTRKQFGVPLSTFQVLPAPAEGESRAFRSYNRRRGSSAAWRYGDDGRTHCWALCQALDCHWSAAG